MKIFRCLCCFLMLGNLAYGQVNEYDYTRKLIDINDQWHKLTLPNDVFGKVKSDFSDLRVFGIDTGKDTIEAPYILEHSEQETSQEAIDFKILNKAYDDNGHYFTLALDKPTSINQIQLSFQENNFDWNLKLEGSLDHQKWLTIVEDYRILSIDNSNTQYKFTKVNIPNSNYRFFRVTIPSKEKVNLLSANVFLNKKISGNYQVFIPKSTATTENKEAKQTEIVVDLGVSVPVSKVKIDVANDFDFYRPLVIQYMVDSFETQNGWKYRYQNLSSVTLSSIEENIFYFNSTVLRKLRFLIKNNDNEALTINSIQAEGAHYQLLVRFTKEADYLLAYGNSNARKPHYDIDYFTNNIPEKLSLIQLGAEQKTKKHVSVPKTPLFENMAWLWGVMGIIIVLLGWFSFKMMKES